MTHSFENGLQAEILARYKPVIDASSLIPRLKQMNAWATDALEQLKSTRHIVLYYEDLVRNSTVSSLAFSTLVFVC